eukprot:TRINITY_DN3328_c0_g1_i2.p1 TRINITY_DN3328_c0_g1~~TRINITY_DN3328_c0_g1_i2.p1  ORF type:complete len:159 (-),score=35.99 TRINITY_DN3328_c0_g1_i2:86-562(-)
MIHAFWGSRSIRCVELSRETVSNSSLTTPNVAEMAIFRGLAVATLVTLAAAENIDDLSLRGAQQKAVVEKHAWSWDKKEDPLDAFLKSHSHDSKVEEKKTETKTETMTESSYSKDFLDDYIKKAREAREHDEMQKKSRMAATGRVSTVRLNSELQLDK